VRASDTVYVDANSIKKKQGIVSYSSLANMTTMGLNSVVTFYKANCQEKIVTETKSVYYGQPMGKGELIQEETLNRSVSPKPNSTEYAAMKFACDFKK